MILPVFYATLSQIRSKSGGEGMPDSNITKRALATALKSLMNAKPFAKISVGDICEFCDMISKEFLLPLQR